MGRVSKFMERFDKFLIEEFGFRDQVRNPALDVKLPTWTKAEFDDETYRLPSLPAYHTGFRDVTTSFSDSSHASRGIFSIRLFALVQEKREASEYLYDMVELVTSVLRSNRQRLRLMSITLSSSAPSVSRVAENIYSCRAEYNVCVDGD